MIRKVLSKQLFRSGIPGNAPSIRFSCPIPRILEISGRYIAEHLEPGNDGVTNMKSSEYDRNELFNSILWIGALEAILSWCEACPELNEKVVYTVEDTQGSVLKGVSADIYDDAKKELARCRTYVETVLWDETMKCPLLLDKIEV